MAGAAAGRFIMVEEEGVGPTHPFSGEKLSLVLTVYRAPTSTRRCKAVARRSSTGRAAAIPAASIPGCPTRPALAAELDVVRVLVNQAHTFGNGGGFNNGLTFTLSMGCGTWAGNTISENLN